LQKSTTKRRCDCPAESLLLTNRLLPVEYPITSLNLFPKSRCSPFLIAVDVSCEYSASTVGGWGFSRLGFTGAAAMLCASPAASWGSPVNGCAFWVGCVTAPVLFSTGADGWGYCWASIVGRLATVGFRTTNQYPNAAAPTMMITRALSNKPRRRIQDCGFGSESFCETVCSVYAFAAAGATATPVATGCATGS